jgi:hypothetical protein
LSKEKPPALKGAIQYKAVSKEAAFFCGGGAGAHADADKARPSLSNQKPSSLHYESAYPLSLSRNLCGISLLVVIAVCNHFLNEEENK